MTKPNNQIVCFTKNPKERSLYLPSEVVFFYEDHEEYYYHCFKQKNINIILDYVKPKFDLYQKLGMSWHLGQKIMVLEQHVCVLSQMDVLYIWPSKLEQISKLEFDPNILYLQNKLVKIENGSNCRMAKVVRRTKPMESMYLHNMICRPDAFCLQQTNKSIQLWFSN